MKQVRAERHKFNVGFKGVSGTTDTSVLDMSYAVDCRNFCFEKGVLTGAIGIDVAKNYDPAGAGEYPATEDDQRIRNVFLYRYRKDGVTDDRLVIHLDNGRLMYTSIGKTDGWHALDPMLLKGELSGVNYNYNGDDMLLLSSGEDGLYAITGDMPLVCSEAPHFTSIAVYNERVYGSINGNFRQVWFSADFNPSNWRVSEDEAGYISFNDECGDVIKVVSFLNFLYIFREFGIFRLTAYGPQSEFMLKKVFVDTGKIVAGSIEVCGDRIIFYAEKGLYSFDGYDITPIAKQLAGVNRTDAMSGAYLDGIYYLACNIHDTGGKNDSVVAVNLPENTISYLCGTDVAQMRTVRASAGADVYCVFRESDRHRMGVMAKSGSIMGGATLKRYVSPYNTLSTPAHKVIRRVNLLTRHPLTLKVKLDGKVYSYKLGGSEKLQSVAVERSGRRVGFELESDSADAYVAPFTVELDFTWG